MYFIIISYILISIIQKGRNFATNADNKIRSNLSISPKQPSVETQIEKDELKTLEDEFNDLSVQVSDYFNPQKQEPIPKVDWAVKIDKWFDETRIGKWFKK